MIAFAVGRAEQAFLKDCVVTVPERKRETGPLFLIADASQSVLAPPIGAGAGLVMGEEISDVPVVAIILLHGAPVPFTLIRVVQAGCLDP